MEELKTEEERKKILHESKPHRKMLEKKPYPKTSEYLKESDLEDEGLLKDFHKHRQGGAHRGGG